MRGSVMESCVTGISSAIGSSRGHRLPRSTRDGLVGTMSLSAGSKTNFAGGLVHHQRVELTERVTCGRTTYVCECNMHPATSGSCQVVKLGRSADEIARESHGIGGQRRARWLTAPRATRGEVSYIVANYFGQTTQRAGRTR